MLQNNPLVSIVVPTFNRLNYLKECVDSLLYQTYKNIEIVITDDGSSDGTFEWVQGVQKLHDNVKYVKNRKYPHGPNGNKNNGLDHVSGEIVGILDDDDKLLPDAIEKLLKKMQEGYDVVMANCIRSDDGKFSGYGLNRSVEVNYQDILCGYIQGEYWSLFKKTLLGNKRFDVALYGGEGLLWKQVLKNAKIYYIHEGVRIYRIHPQSVTHHSLVMPKKVIRNYEKDIELFSNEMKILCPCELAKVYKGAAYFAKLSSQYSKGLNYLLSAMWLCPKYISAYLMMIVFFLPKKIIPYLSKIRVKFTS